MRGIVLQVMLAGVLFLVAGCEQDRSVPTAPATAPAQAQFGKVASPKLKVDQSNNVSDQLGLGNGLYGQTFVPKADNLAQVDLLLIVNQVPSSGVETTVGLFTDITQAPIATTVAFVEGAVPGELRRTISYGFDPPVPLDKKTTYTIGWYGPAEASWEFAFGDPYPPGQVVLYNGVPLNPIADFVFTTYALK